MLAMAAAPARAWDPVEKVETYQVSGRTGIELYRSIGENGPKAGVGQAIAYTTYELLWSRDYRSENGGCRLASARPRLTIIYKLPKAPRALPEPTAALWKRFIAGIETHERVHGDIILDTVRKIETATVGLSVPGDAGCKSIRTEVQRRIGELAAEMRARHRRFDSEEMASGGNVHALVLGLVNGQ